MVREAMWLLAVCLVCVVILASGTQDISILPPGFLFGAATASYQIEGAWNLDGKGENIWDRLTHSKPKLFKDFSNGDIAADSYHRYKDDIKALKDMGMNVYRFSISWSRVLPTGEANDINPDGITYYNNLIDELLANGIQPMVTMYHWDLPQALQDVGGWTNSDLAQLFEEYANVLYTNFGDRVKWWITIDAPTEVCRGYSEGVNAPAIKMPGVGDYQAGHTLLMAHARAYHLYHRTFVKQQQGKVSIALDSAWFEPERNTSDGKMASHTALQFLLGWFAHPVYVGDYPAVMKERIGRRSLAEGRQVSRLPEFSQEWVQFVKGSWDFFALNHFTSDMVRFGEAGLNSSKDRDSGIVMYPHRYWPGSASPWLKVVPWGMRKILKYISTEYKNPPIFITQSGFSDRGILHDLGRANYYLSYLEEMLKAHYLDGVNVIGFTAWSLIDGFEWQRGYTVRFGLYHVNFMHPSRPRTPKYSAKVISEITSKWRIPKSRPNIHTEL